MRHARLCQASCDSFRLSQIQAVARKGVIPGLQARARLAAITGESF